MATRFASRTGATVRMAVATASCAVTVALSGADDCCDLAVDIRSWGSLTTRLHTPGVSTWRINAVFLSVSPPLRLSSRSRPIWSRRWQALDYSDIRVPGSHQPPPRRIVGRRAGLRAIALEALEDDFVHLARRNTARGAEAHIGRQPPANKSITDLGPQFLPGGRQRR